MIPGSASSEQDKVRESAVTSLVTSLTCRWKTCMIPESVPGEQDKVRESAVTSLVVQSLTADGMSVERIKMLFTSFLLIENHKLDV